MLRLGLDLGTNSIGWALYRLDAEGEPEELVNGGVLIHSDGRNPQNQSSNARERREKRGPRRNRDRTLRRRKRVAHRLHELGLLPRVTAHDERAAMSQLDPLRLRAQALDRPLTPYELGHILLSFVDRRGFSSNRQADGGEDGAIRQDVSDLRRRMEQSGARTLGEYLWRRHQKGKTIRARLGNGLYPDRAMIEQELQVIRSAQEALHPRITVRDWDAIIDSILFQRKLRPVERGWCTLIESERRAYKAEPLFQRFRIWQDVLNLQYDPPGEGRRPLNDRQRWLIVNKLLSVKSQTFHQLAALAGLPEGSRFNFQTTARNNLDGDLTAAVLGAKKCFGKRKWANLGLKRQQEVVERLLEVESHDALIEWLRTERGLSEQAADAVASSRLPQGTGHLSRAAIERLLPYMEEEGLPYDQALKAAGFSHHSDLHGDGAAARLPYYGEVLTRDVIGGRPGGRTEAERIGKISNPTVHIALGQVRRLFNAIADRHGKPDEVVVELARELRQNKRDRERDQQRNLESQKRNERLRELAANAGFPEPSSLDMRKLRLWDEQGPANGRVCPFTGETLSLQRVLSDETEIEHILPYSRTLDDSMPNTVLATRAANREKGRRAPHEAWGDDPVRYEQILARAELLPPNKRWRFQADAMQQFKKQGDFLSRQLNDTRYLSRSVKRYLESVVEPNRIWVTPGRLTAMLRAAWGLDSLISDSDQKERNDHRHHLIDAAVVGMTSRSLLQRVAHDSGRGVDDLGQRVAKSVNDPWEDFRLDVKALIERVVVRHRPDHFQPRPGGTTGSLHRETAYGVVDGPDAKGIMTLVVTKSLMEEMKPSDLSKVRDSALRERLQRLWLRVDAEDGKPAEKWNRFAERAHRELKVRRVRLLARHGKDNLAFIRDNTDRIYKAYETHGNAYMDIWLLPNGKTTGETINRFNAHSEANYFDNEQRNYRSQVKADYPQARKLMRLQINDMIAVGEGKERRLMRVLKLSGHRIEAVDHTAGGKIENVSRYRKSAGQVLQAGLRKVSVNILGQVADGGSFDQSGRGTYGRR